MPHCLHPCSACLRPAWSRSTWHDPDATAVSGAVSHATQSPASEHSSEVPPVDQAAAVELVTLFRALWAPAPQPGHWGAARCREPVFGLAGTTGHQLHHAALCQPQLATVCEALPSQVPLLQPQGLEKPPAHLDGHKEWDCWGGDTQRDTGAALHGCRAVPGKGRVPQGAGREQLGRALTPYPHICAAAVLKNPLSTHLLCFCFFVCLFFSPNL